MDKLSAFVQENAKDLVIGLSVVALLFAMAYQVRKNNLEKKAQLRVLESVK